MQTIHFNISEALKLLKRLLIYFEYLRFNDDEEFEKFILNATELAKEIGIKPVVERSQDKIFAWRTRRNFSYENMDDH